MYIKEPSSTLEFLLPVVEGVVVVVTWLVGKANACIGKDDTPAGQSIYFFAFLKAVRENEFKIIYYYFL